MTLPHFWSSFEIRPSKAPKFGMFNAFNKLFGVLNPFNGFMETLFPDIRRTLPGLVLIEGEVGCRSAKQWTISCVAISPTCRPLKTFDDEDDPADDVTDTGVPVPFAIPTTEFCREGNRRNVIFVSAEPELAVEFRRRFTTNFSPKKFFFLNTNIFTLKRMKKFF